MGKIIKGGLIVGGIVLTVVSLFKLTRRSGKEEVCETGTEPADQVEYGLDGFDADGFDRNGFNAAGYDRDGYDRSGYDREGYNRFGYNLSGYNREGFDRYGFNRAGYNRRGLDRGGVSKEEAGAQLDKIQELLETSLPQAKSGMFREAMINIRTGLDSCVKSMLRHKTGKQFDGANFDFSDRINMCRDYKLLDSDEVNRLHSARWQVNDVHELFIDKEFNDVYFCYKTLEETLDKARKYLGFGSASVKVVPTT